jgi:6-pyruvoyltetrahydropterin/6-carboxytetrahydropterin synthase
MREFRFEMAHMLEGYDGLCSHIHGHSYRLFVTVQGTPLQDETSPKNGMTIDFGELKRLVNGLIVERFDHSLVVRRSLAGRLPAGLPGFERVVAVDYQPTCENMAVDFASVLRAALPAGLRLYSLRLHETASSCAEWFADDND